ncbi:MAG: ATP-binding protein [Simkaniaceae bacterium]|nr:ATP-binding protein [Candidatus Sacchlamyda saccharinae]
MNKHLSTFRIGHKFLLQDIAGYCRILIMDEISNLLAQPESKTLEFKKNLSSLQPILKTIVAFANTSGGTLVIGIDPSKKILGIHNILKSEEALANAIADSIEPALLPEIEIATVQNKNLLIVKVSHWKAPFYLKKEGIPRGVYIRLGSTSRPAGPEIIEELKRSITNLSYDQQAVSGLMKDALDLEKIKAAFNQIKKQISKDKLLSLGILTHYNGGIAPSIGGLILFGKKEIRETYVPDARVRCARFNGKDKTEILDHQEIDGSILDAVMEIPKFISRNTRLGAKIQKIRRKDIPEYPEVAIREILINALAHADYSISGSAIQVAIFDDRLEIQNPGMLPFGFTMEDLKSGVSRVRNRVIAKVFHELKLMEEWGSGYKRVIQACQNEGYLEPNWMEHGTTMRVTFYSGRKKTTSTSTELTERQKAILSLFRKGKSLPFRTIFDAFSSEISERMLRYELSQLKNKGLLTPKGKGPSTVWAKN